MLHQSHVPLVPVTITLRRLPRGVWAHKDFTLITNGEEISASTGPLGSVTLNLVPHEPNPLWEVHVDNTRVGTFRFRDNKPNYSFEFTYHPF